VLVAGCEGRRQLQSGALPPSRRADDKRKRDGQNKNVADNATHRAMLTGQAESRQQNFCQHARQYDRGEADSYLSLVVYVSDNARRMSNLSQCAAISFKRPAR
jgi:hypothetical protein